MPPPAQPISIPAPILHPSVGSFSVASSGSGSGFVSGLPLPPPPLPLASSSRQTLDSAQLRALYIPHPTRFRGRSSVSYIYLSVYFY